MASGASSGKECGVARDNKPHDGHHDHHFCARAVLLCTAGKVYRVYRPKLPNGRMEALVGSDGVAVRIGAVHHRNSIDGRAAG